MLCLSDEDSSLGAPIYKRSALHMPTHWPGLQVNTTLNKTLGISPIFSFREILVPYTCEAFKAPLLGLEVICDIEHGLTVSEEGVTNIKELLMSGWTVELHSSDGVDHATCTREGPDGNYQFYLEGQIEFANFAIGKALLGDMILIGPELMRDLHQKTLESATESVRIASKNHDFCGRVAQCLSIGGSSPLLPTPEFSAVELGQCPSFPVTMIIFSHIPVNPQAATYLRYSPMKPGTWNKVSIPYLGLSVDSKGDIIITQGLIVLLDAKLLLSSEWRCLQDPYWVVPGIFKRTIANYDHSLHIHGGYVENERGNTLVGCTYMHLRSKSLSNLEIIEGEIKSTFTPEEN